MHCFVLKEHPGDLICRGKETFTQWRMKMHTEYLFTVQNILLYLIIPDHKFWMYCGSGFWVFLK